MAEQSLRAELESRRQQRTAAPTSTGASLRQELEARRAAGRSQGAPQAPANRAGLAPGMQAFARSAIGRLLNNAMGVPDLAATAGASFINTVGFGAPKAIAGAMGVQFPQIGDRIVPGMPQASQIFGGAQRLGEGAAAMATGNWQQFRPDATAQQQAITSQLTAQHPIASGFGGAAGDAATLLTGRAPFMGGLARRPPITSVPQFVDAPADAMRTLARIGSSKAAQGLATSAGRSLEAGVEGAVLAVLNEGEPLETAAYAAGSQLAGSAMLGLGKGMVSGGPIKAGLKLGASAYAVGSLIQLMNSVGDNSIIGAVETGYDKVAFSLFLAATAGAAGAGRLRGSMFAEEFPRFADALSAVPRGMVISALNEHVKQKESGGTNSIERVVNQLAQDPGYFGPEATLRLQRALTREGASLVSTIDGLIQSDSDFRAKYDAIGTVASQTNPVESMRQAISEDNKGIADPISATKVAQVANSRLPANSPHRKLFESSGPRAFIGRVLSDGESATQLLNALTATQRQSLLEVNLGQLLFASTKDEEGQKGKVLDPERFQAAWSSQPSQVREAYAPGTRKVIERFIGEALSSPPSGAFIPPYLAHSLMLPGGKLALHLGGGK